ncbi:hypothetical protein A3739_21985 [Oleiphilus sp. HI0067]|nr:hypothetical protein A3739_21985 [Oleiphilus sp. HI0067]
MFGNARLGLLNTHLPDLCISESSDLDCTLKVLEQNPDNDLLLLDLHMSGSQDSFGLVTVPEKFPTVPLTIISARENVETISRCIAHGSIGFIPKSCSPSMIKDAIDHVIDGES